VFSSSVKRLLISASGRQQAQPKGYVEMNGRRLVLVTGAILFIAGVIGLFVPVSISGGIGCGTAVHSDVSAARAQDDQNIGNSPVVQQIPIANQVAPKSQFVAECNAALGDRRLWTIPLIVGGVVIAAVTFVRGPKHPLVVSDTWAGSTSQKLSEVDSYDSESGCGAIPKT
jgi:hypothetical protein